MKVLELRFKNLNSLYGEWFIDFTAPEYGANGIFALTGPTGAGKSTILDAICLALYGATPRLGKITKSGNEIMSRQTGECYAEVTFESQAGQFRCHWSQHRARRKSAGNLTDSKHEIADVQNGQILESKKRNVAGVIEEKTGMDFDRFTRSILLAQGGFDTFLKADVEQKSKILEQITGTEIYTEISRRVHERQRDEREKLTILQAEISGIAILSDNEEAEMNHELDEKRKKEIEVATKFLETGKAIAWLKGIDGLRAEINALSAESEKLNGELDRFKPERERLGRAQKAAELDGLYARLTSVRKQQEEDQQSFKSEAGKLPEIESSAQQKEEALKKAEQVTEKAKEKQKSAAPLIQKIRSLDLQLTDRKKSIDDGDANCKKEREQITADKTLLEREKKKLETAQNHLKLVQDYLEANVRDELLVSGFAGIEEQLNTLFSFQKDITEKTRTLAKAEKQLHSAAKNLTTHTGQFATCKQELKDAQKQVELKKKALTTLLGERLLREYRTEKETLLRELAFLQKIADLESERTKLEDGLPCPLCGSKEHPFAEGNVPVKNETEKTIEGLTELIQNAEQLESNIKDLEAAEKETLKKVNASEKLESNAANEKKNAERNLSDITQELKKNNERLADLKKSALARLQPLGIQEIPDSEVSLLQKSLKERLTRWQDNLKKKSEFEKDISKLDSELKRLDAVIETRNKGLFAKLSALDTLKKEFEAQSAERRDLFGAKSPDTEEARLGKAVSDAELAEKSVRTAGDEAKKLLHSAKENIAFLEERIVKRVPGLKQLETEFASAMLTAGFADEQHFIANRLSLPEREKLATKAKDLDDRHTDLQARKKDRDGRLALEINKKVTESTLEELEPVNKELEDSLKLLRDGIIGLKHKLADNNVAKERVKEKQSEIEAQKKECNRWEKLHGLIGSADGKKYRNFAQGLTFELMVSHANRQLEKMTDRYLLIRDDEQPLELNVVDNYQAGEIRSTKNLSGGESFIVSLTLALGLSKMASRKVRVDSLFLDEGFGTLDEEALETALETLSSLHQDGKLIGIISHINALKERISTQISITPVSGGKSIITGPGCSKVIGDS